MAGSVNVIYVLHSKYEKIHKFITTRACARCYVRES